MPFTVLLMDPWEHTKYFHGSCMAGDLMREWAMMKVEGQSKEA